MTRMASMEEEIREVPAAPNQTISLPGDRSEEQRQDSLREGISLDMSLVDQLNALADQLHVASLG